MHASVLEAEARPFVETTIARHLQSRLEITHEERGIAVISGPWGIGKTTAIDAFANKYECQCAVVKVDPGSSKAGATPIAVMQLAIEAMRPLLHRSERATLSNAYWSLRQMIYNNLSSYFELHLPDADDPNIHRFTFIFDEAQYLSPKAIEMLRFWNDNDRTTTPFPVGLAFIGNNEFALQEDASGNSVISGAVRSRALFVEALNYEFVTDADLVLFAQSRGLNDAAAISVILKHYDGRRVKRDLRNVERMLGVIHRRAMGGPITQATVQAVLNPA